jgi:Fe-S-cluster-containing hydrogenase component 2
VWCPEAAIALDADDYPVVDYTVCKGCLLCAHECPTQAFSVAKEGGAERLPGATASAQGSSKTRSAHTMAEKGFATFPPRSGGKEVPA